MGMPAFKMLNKNSVERARLLTIREAVRPLLGTNYLSHFTDHSVEHSDQLCELVDDLASSLSPNKKLNLREAAALYAACYCHDIGMQHERAGETNVVKNALKLSPFCGQDWFALDLMTRQNLVRENHHRISEELVRDAMLATNPALGIPLNDNDSPGVIAVLCLTHCLGTDSPEYQSATADQGDLRVGLLSALLRLADILDESRRRSHLYLEQTRNLPLESRLHWWRHYYVASVSVQERAITVWFDFPPSRRQQYKDIFEPLQMPLIDEELKRHSGVLTANNLAWNLQARDTPESQSTARVMDDDLERYAVEQAVQRRSEQFRQDRIATVKQLRIARPTIERQFAALRDSNKGADEQLGEALKLAEHLAKIGGRRDGCMSLWGVLNQTKARASEAVKLNAALRLGELMVDDRTPKLARDYLAEFIPQFTNLPNGSPMKLRYLRLWGAVLRDNCDYSRAVPVFEELARTTDQPTEREMAEAEIVEMHLLQGEMAKIGVDGGGSC